MSRSEETSVSKTLFVFTVSLLSPIRLRVFPNCGNGGFNEAIILTPAEKTGYRVHSGLLISRIFPDRENVLFPGHVTAAIEEYTLPLIVIRTTQTLRFIPICKRRISFSIVTDSFLE